MVIAMVVVAGALVVAAGVAVLLANAVNLRSSTQATLRADRYLLAVGEIEDLVVDAETGVRGYVANGDPLFLAPLHEAQAQLPPAYTALRHAAAANHAYGAQVDRLISAASSYLAVYVAGELRLAARSLPAARSVAATDAGKRRVDAIRLQTTTLQGLVATRQAARERSARGTANHSITDAIVLLVLLTLLTLVLGGYLGRLATSRERARELADRTTRTLQQSLVPRSVPAIPGFELAIRFLPEGGDLVGGDFYDIYEIVPRRWSAIVGDVCGKGPAAAAVSAMARWTLRSLTGEDVPPEEATRFLNDLMLRQGFDERYLTLAYLSITLAGEHAVLRAVCAGHPAPILVPADGPPVALAASGDLLGVWNEVRLQTADVQLGPGDTILLYTDGVTDQGPGSRPRLEDALAADGGGPASAEGLARRLERVAREAYAVPRDDIAIVAMRFLGSGPGAEAAAGGGSAPALAAGFDA